MHERHGSPALRAAWDSPRQRAPRHDQRSALRTRRVNHGRPKGRRDPMLEWRIGSGSPVAAPATSLLRGPCAKNSACPAPRAQLKAGRGEFLKIFSAAFVMFLSRFSGLAPGFRSRSAAPRHTIGSGPGVHHVDNQCSRHDPLRGCGAREVAERGPPKPDE